MVAFSDMFFFIYAQRAAEEQRSEQRRECQ